MKNPVARLQTDLLIGGEKSVRGWVLVLAFGALMSATVSAEMYQAPPTPGGIDPQPKITGLVRTPTNATLNWYGPTGPYHVLMTPAFAPVNWSNVLDLTASNYANSVTLSNLPDDQGFFRLSTPLNGYVGSGGCSGCHAQQYDPWWRTDHAVAYDSIAGLPPSVRQSCLPCHTVGQGKPAGFTDLTNTPHLSDVGCENCHGPAGAHKYGEHDLVHPIVTMASEVCGGCHTDDHHPTYDEWKASGHSFVTPDVANGSSGITNAGTVGTDRQASCGTCHSSATRMAMFNDYRARLEGRTNALVLPDRFDAALWGPTCASCHDPHATHWVTNVVASVTKIVKWPAQLRNPLWSTNYFTMPTTTDKRTVVSTNFMGVKETNIVYFNTTFATMYDPNVQVCGQCHNSRGARWDGRNYVLNSGLNGLVLSAPNYSRPPHHSPQYNILSGIVQPDYLNGTSNIFHFHSLNTNGCAACHMPTKTVTTPTPENPNYTGHEFAPLLPGVATFNGCTVSGCHDGVTTTVDATNGLISLQTEMTNKITALLTALNSWAITKGPALLNPNTYGTNAYTRSQESSWEYPTTGGLSGSTKPGPINADQTNRIPAAIRQARFNLYMVSYGQSLGIHNPTYTRYLLNDASNKVWQASQ